MTTIELRGITWGHTRGFVPLVATAQRYSELHPNVSIGWEKRTLQEFADFPLERLVERFDLLVIDHPSVGAAAAHNLLVPFDQYLPAAFLADQAANSVGASYASYSVANHQWALAIDAATPVSGYRPDLLEKAGVEPPGTWADLLELAERGLVVMAGIPIDSLCHFYMLCTGLRSEPFRQEEAVVPDETGIRALVMLRELMQKAIPGCLARNPIAVWELLSSGDGAAYCPFAYGYSNYARPGYARHALEFGGLIGPAGGLRCRSTLGGAGLAISSRCRHIEAAADYCAFTAGAGCQTGLYFEAGGQPGYRAAWLDDRINASSRNFFRNTLPTLEEAWLRPRWDGYLNFQDAAGEIVHAYLLRGGDPALVVGRLNSLLRSTRTKELV